MSTGQHLLHIDCIEAEGYIRWRFTCAHTEDDQRWWCRETDGSFTEPPGADGCWLESWWSAIGSELLDDIAGPITAFPIAVKPGDGWDYDQGGTLVAEVGA